MREKNIIIHGVNEIDSSEPSVRKQNDTKFVTNLAEFLEFCFRTDGSLLSISFTPCIIMFFSLIVLSLISDTFLFTVSSITSVLLSALHWYCPSCEEKVMKNLRTDREVEKRCSEFMQKMEGRIKTLEIKIESKVNSEEVVEIDLPRV
jgi:hypothetical protein